MRTSATASATVAHGERLERHLVGADEQLAA